MSQNAVLKQVLTLSPTLISILSGTKAVRGEVLFPPPAATILGLFSFVCASAGLKHVNITRVDVTTNAARRFICQYNSHMSNKNNSHI
jgi:hypothetical protein